MAERPASSPASAPARAALASRTRLLAIARKEWLQLRRDPRSLILAFALPVLLLVLFGYAITWDVHDLDTLVVDQDHSAASRSLTEAFTSSGYFRLVGRLDRPGAIPRAFAAGTARVALVFPPDFAAAIDAGRPAPLQVLVDGSDANTATIALAYTGAVVQSWASRQTAAGRRIRLPIVSESRVWYNEELLSRNMIVPGLVAVIMAIIAAMLTSLTIAREWERGTMEQLAATPVTRAEVVIGKLLPYLAIGFTDVAATSVLGVVLFHVPFRGDPLLLAVLAFFFVTGALGFGIFISAATRSQILATQMAMIFTFLPAFLLSGFMFSIDVMPAPLRILSYAFPARYFLTVTRGIFLKGIGAEALWGQGLLMVVFATVGIGLAVKTFKKELA